MPTNTPGAMHGYRELQKLQVELRVVTHQHKTKIPGKLHLNANARKGLLKGVCKTICLEVNAVFVPKIESRRCNHSKNDREGTIRMEIWGGSRTCCDGPI
jgi:hypothetical protein